MIWNFPHFSICSPHTPSHLIWLSSHLLKATLNFSVLMVLAVRSPGQISYIHTLSTLTLIQLEDSILNARSWMKLQKFVFRQIFRIEFTFLSFFYRPFCRPAPLSCSVARTFGTKIAKMYSNVAQYRDGLLLGCQFSPSPISLIGEK